MDNLNASENARYKKAITGSVDFIIRAKRVVFLDGIHSPSRNTGIAKHFPPDLSENLYPQNLLLKMCRDDNLTALLVDFGKMLTEQDMLVDHGVMYGRLLADAVAGEVVRNIGNSSAGRFGTFLFNNKTPVKCFFTDVLIICGGPIQFIMSNIEDYIWYRPTVVFGDDKVSHIPTISLRDLELQSEAIMDSAFSEPDLEFVFDEALLGREISEDCRMSNGFVTADKVVMGFTYIASDGLKSTDDEWPGFIKMLTHLNTIIYNFDQSDTKIMTSSAYGKNISYEPEIRESMSTPIPISWLGHFEWSKNIESLVLETTKSVKDDRFYNRFIKDTIFMEIAGDDNMGQVIGSGVRHTIASEMYDAIKQSINTHKVVTMETD